MVQLSPAALFLRTILEGIVVILSVYLLSNTKVDKKRLMVCGVFLGLCTYLVRLLPVHFGVHTIVLVLAIIFLSVKICRIEIYNAIASSIIFIIILFVSEWLSVIVHDNLFSSDMRSYFNNSLTGILFTLAPLFFALLVVVLIRYIKSIKQNRVV